MNPKNLLNELKWHPEKNLDNVKITFIHRGAEDDKKIISAYDIIDLGKSFFSYKSKYGETHIPYHRVLNIKKDDQILWNKGR